MAEALLEVEQERQCSEEYSPYAGLPSEAELDAAIAEAYDPTAPNLDCGKEYPFVVGKLRPHHEEIARLLALGKAHRDIAAALGLAVGTVWDIAHSPAVQRRILQISHERTRLSAKVVGDLVELAEKAVEVYREALTNPAIDIKHRLATASQIFDRAGLPRQTAALTVTQQAPSPEYQAELRAKALELARQAGNVIDGVCAPVKEIHE